MRKRVLKRKKEIKVHKGNRPARRVMILAALMGLLVQTSLAVYGREAEGAGDSVIRPKEVITNIYHRHVGSPDTQGGCYQKPVAHEHQGDEKNGGGCYTLPVVHIHEGSPAGGGCYTRPIIHEHQGDEISGGECFKPVYHEHGEDCYHEERCKVTNVGGALISTTTDHCLQHGDTDFDTVEGISYHESCGIGSEPTQLYYCRLCGYFPVSHKYSVLHCDREGEIIGYEKDCEREGEIEGYGTACGYEDNEIERYEPGCGITADGYEIDCGLNEDIPCGRLILTSDPDQDGEKVKVSVRVEDLSGGRIQLTDDPYSWSDSNGKSLGSGEQIEVDENGTYSVTVSLKNRDVDESGLKSSILVEGIGKGTAPTEVPTATPTEAPGAETTASPEASPSQTSDPGHTPEREPEKTPVTTPEKTPVTTPEKAPDDDGSGGQEGTKEDGAEEEEAGALPAVTPGPESGEEKDSYSGNAERVNFGDKNAEEPSVSPSPVKTAPLMKQESEEVKAKENMSAGENRSKNAQIRKRNMLFASPAVRMITLTAGTLALIAGLLFLLLYLRRSVKLYNDDGEGRMVYLGRCLVRMEEEGYCITITESMIEKSCTNRYRIKAGIFRIGKDEEQEMIVYKEEKKAVVCFGKEMIVTL